GLLLVVLHFGELGVDHIGVFGLATLRAFGTAGGAGLGLGLGVGVHLLAQLLADLAEGFGLGHDGVLVVGLHRLFSFGDGRFDLAFFVGIDLVAMLGQRFL